MSQASRNVRSTHRTLRDAVYEQLVDDIMHARLKPGERITETQLAELYGVSRGPLREALSGLHRQGLVHLSSGKGAVITMLSGQEVREIYEIRIELEALAARLGTQNIKAKQTELMARLLQRMSSASVSNAAWQQLAEEFHLTLYRAANRGRLYELIKKLNDLTVPYQRLYLSSRQDYHADPDHSLLYDAVIRRDDQTVERITREHLQKAAETTARLVDNYSNQVGKEVHETG